MPGPTRGRPASSSVDEIVDAALLIARNAGLEEVSMRRVATTVGVGTMTLYNYVPGRNELIALMIDRAYSEMTLPTPDMDWRPALELYAREHFDMYLRDGWLFQTSILRIPLAPAVLDSQEAGLRAVDETGLTPAAMAEVMSLVDIVVQGIARWTVGELQDQRKTGITAEAYWEANNVFWAKWFDPERYPMMTKVYMAGGFDHAGSFDATLESVLENVEQAIQSAQSG